jgi:hypothetical protein
VCATTLRDENFAITVMSKAQGVPSRWSGLCSVLCGNLVSTTFSFFFSFFLFLSLPRKMCWPRNFFYYYCFRISNSIIFLIFCMIFVLISFVNFKFDFDLTLDWNVICHFVLVSDLIRFLLILGFYFDFFCKLF